MTTRTLPWPVAPAWPRPRASLLAALTVAMVCLPQQPTDLASSVHVTPADLTAVALVAVAALSALITRRRLSRRLWVLGPPVIAVAVATLAAETVTTSMPGFVRYIEIFALIPLAIVIVVRDGTDRKVVAGSVVAAALVEAGVGIWQAVTGTGASYAGQTVRAVGTFGAVDVMGMATVVSYGLIIALGVALSARGRWRVAALTAMLVLTPALVMSLSRGAWLAFVVAAAVMIALSGWRTAVRVAVVSASIAVLIVGIGPGSATLATRITSITSAATQPDQSVTDRYGLWEAATRMWSDHPLAGVGPRGFAEFRDAYAPLHVSGSSDTADSVNGFHRQQLLSPHNMYLLVLSEQGLLGMTAFCLLVGALVLWSAKSTLRARFPGRRTAASSPWASSPGP